MKYGSYPFFIAKYKNTQAINIINILLTPILAKPDSNEIEEVNTSQNVSFTQKVETKAEVKKEDLKPVGNSSENITSPMPGTTFRYVLNIRCFYIIFLFKYIFK